MGKAAAVSFEESEVKIVHASLKGRNVTIEKTAIVPDEEFDAYLRSEKASEFIVTCEFREAYHNVVSIPVVKQQHLKKVIESEIRKASAQKDFTFIYFPIGEKVLENRKVLEVFYYAVGNETLRRTVRRFYDNGKIVKALYPSVFAAAALFDAGSSGEAHMGVFSSGRSRIVFFAKRGAIHFIRNYESVAAELTDFDIQNINMTISYCFQNFRANPSAVFLMGSLCESAGVSAVSTAPLTCVPMAEYIHCSKETFNGFILPLAALHAPRSSNVLNQEFKNVYILKNYMAYASVVFILSALLCAGLISYEVKSASGKREQINSEIKSRTDVESILSEYNSRKDMMMKYTLLVEFLNKPSPDIRGFLISLAEIDMRNSILNSVTAAAKDGSSFSASMHGAISVDKYSELQDVLSGMTEALGKVEGLKVENKTVDLKDKTFTLEMSYNKTQ